MHEPLYKTLLGESYNSLPAAIQQLHDVRQSLSFYGQSRVTRGRGRLSRMMGWILGLPRPGEVPIQLTFTRQGDREYWSRRFGEDVFRSTQWLSHGKLYEKINTVTLVFHVQANVQGLQLHVESIRFLGIPIFKLLRPKIVAQETEAQGRACFLVDVTLPLIGHLVRYEGWLEPEIDN